MISRPYFFQCHLEITVRLRSKEDMRTYGPGGQEDG
jgi:hypothetical protein